jgi:phage gpG-like protein
MLSRAENARPAMQEGSVLFSGEIQKNFAESGRPDRWLPSQRVVRHGGQTLRKSGHLQHTLLLPEVGDKSITFGSNLPYAAIHLFGGEIRRYAHSELFVRNRVTNEDSDKLGQFKKGTSKGRGHTVGEYTIKMPKRYYMYFSPESVATFGDIVREYLLGGFAAKWRA